MILQQVPLSYIPEVTAIALSSLMKRKEIIDRFQNNDSRKFSMIMYLNTDWVAEDGGEICIHHEAGPQNISPINGKIVFFKSNVLEHEVLVTHKNRMSITGWLKG